VATTDLPTCRSNIASNVLIGLEKATPECKGKVTAMLCAYFYTNGMINEAQSCVNSSKTWCLDYCQELYGCLGALLTPADCLSTTTGNTDCTPVNTSTLDLFRTPPPPPKLERQCPDPDAPTPSLALLLTVEIGGLYPALDCVINNFPCDVSNLTLISRNASVPNYTLTKVFRPNVPFSALFPEKCAKYATYVWTPYVIFCALWYPITIIAFILFTLRRKKSPISARSYPLVSIQYFWSQIAVYATIDPMMYGVTGTCWFGSAYAAVFSTPAVSLTFILRASRLYYLYRWNQDKLNPEKRGWYVQHREWLLPKRYLTVYWVSMIFVLIIFIIYMVTFPHAYTQGLLIDSGRCSWWDMNSQVQQFADANQISMNPSVLNPTGYVPYSVSYNTCKFCHMSEARQISWSEFGIIWFVVALVMIVKLRKLNDQYHLWHELFLQLCLYIIAAAISLPFPNPDYAALFAYNAHTHIAIVIGTILNCLAIIIPIFMPLYFSYLWEWQGAKKKEKNSINTSEALRNVKIKQDKYGNAYANEEINYKLFLQDENGMEAFRQFCVESFFAEMASFYVKYRQYQEIKNLEEKREAAKFIYFEFIRENAPYELNIPYNFRIKYWEEFEAGHVGTLDGDEMKQPQSGFLWRPIWSALTQGKRRSVTKAQPRESGHLGNGDVLKPKLEIKSEGLPSDGSIEMPKDDDNKESKIGLTDGVSARKLETKSAEAKRLPIDDANMQTLTGYFVDVHDEICLLISNDWRRFTLSRFYQDFLNHLFEQRHFQSVGIDQSHSAGGNKSSKGDGPADASTSGRSISPLLHSHESMHQALESPSGIRSPSVFMDSEKEEKDDPASDLHEVHEPPGVANVDDDRNDKPELDASARGGDEIEMMEVY